MDRLVKGLVIGVVSGAITYAASYLALGYTSALAMPRDFPLALWDAVVVFGLGATVVALVIHLAAIRILAAPVTSALAGFAIALLVGLVATGDLALGYKVLAAWLVGALLASAAQRWLWPNNSFKGMPLRGTP